jgi:hypothetical protein
VDLGKDYLLSKTELVCYLDRAYQFKVEIKTDGGSTYTQVVNRLNNTQPGSAANPITDTFGEVIGRYVRLTVTGAADYTGTWASILEFRVFGRELSNLALFKTVTYSSQENNSSRAASNVVDSIDNNGELRWSAGPMPQWVEVDLGKDYLLSKTELVCYLDRAYQFKVEVKANGGSTYTQVVNRLNNTQPGSAASPITDTFSEVTGRYVRLTVTGAAVYAGTWASILEFRVFGRETGLKSLYLGAGEIVEIKPAPDAFWAQNYPNPFSAFTNIRFTLPEEGQVTVKIFDLMGKEVAEVTRAKYPAGTHSIVWNACKASGEKVPSGLYFYRVRYNNQVKTNKMLLTE